MAFPNTVTPTSTAFGTASTTHNVTMPATVNSGDLLLVVICTETGASSSPQQSTPSGWTQEVNNVFTSTSNNETGVYSRVADGTEGGTTVNFATTNTAVAAAHAYRVTDWMRALAGVEVTTPPATEATDLPDPPSLSPSWGAEDTLWIAAATGTDDDVALFSSPANYTGGLGTVSGGGLNNGCGVYTAHRQLNAASENPGSFEINQIEATQAVTIAVRQFVGFVMTAGAGSYTITGNDAALVKEAILSAETGSYTINGNAASTFVDTPLQAEVGSYALTGNAVDTRVGFTLNAEVGTYSLNGQAANLLRGLRLEALAGSYDIAGQAVDTLYDRRMVAQTGNYILNGNSIVTLYTPLWTESAPGATSWSDPATDTTTWADAATPSTTWTDS